MQVTIYDIAKMAGVSASTVSRVVNDKPNVGKKTRTKILKLLTEYNYMPNEAARGLVMQASHMVGILITDIRTTHHTDGIYYIERELSANGYSCLIYNTGRDENDWVRHIQALSQRQVEAIILMGSVYQSDVVKEALQLYLPRIPVVICNGYIDAPNVYGLVADEQNGVTDCVRLLKDKNRRRPAFLVNQVTPSNDEKRRGYENGMARFYPGVEPIIRETGNAIKDIYSATRAAFDEHPDMDSIIYSEDMLALIGLRAMADMGKTVPGDVAVIGINNSQYAQISIPTLTSLDNVIYDIGMNAARNILALLSGQRISKKMLICTEIVERQST